MRTILTYQDFLNEKDKNPCWSGYKQIGTKKKRGRVVPNCVKVNENSEYDFDRAEFYLNYYKNLTPSGFEVERSDNSIIINLPLERKMETPAGLELPIVFNKNQDI